MRAFAIAMLVGVAGVTLIEDLGYSDTVLGFVQLIPGRDTTGHFALFGVLSFAVNSWLGSSTRSTARLSHLRTTMMLAVLVTAEEFSQIAISTRSFSYSDLFASLAGLSTGALANYVTCAVFTAAPPNKVLQRTRE